MKTLLIALIIILTAGLSFGQSKIVITIQQIDGDGRTVLDSASGTYSTSDTAMYLSAFATVSNILDYAEEKIGDKVVDSEFKAEQRAIVRKIAPKRESK